MRRKISPKFHVKNGVKNGKFHANFTLPGCSAEISQQVTDSGCPQALKRATPVLQGSKPASEAGAPKHSRSGL